MKKIASLLVCSIALLTSCSIETMVHFNENYGGSQIVSIDMEEAKEMMNSFAPGGESSESMLGENMGDSLAMMEEKMSDFFAGTGLTNFKMGFENESKIDMGFEFKDLESFDRAKTKARDQASEMKGSALGQADKIGEGLLSMAGGDYVRKGKWLTIRLGDKSFMDEMLGVMSGEGEDMGMASGMFGMMGESMTFSYEYTFDRKIKKVKSEIPFEQVEKNKLRVNYSLSTMTKWEEEQKDPKLSVKLK